MRAERSRTAGLALLACVLVHLSTAARSEAADILGLYCDGEIIGRDPVHCWRSIGAGSWEVPEIHGTAVLVRWFDEAIYGRDTNIFIRPDPAYDWVVLNLDDTPNAALDDGAIPARLIEAEAMNITELLDQVILPGMKVRAKGWWVEDVFHDRKTELHPLIYLVADQAPLDTPGSGSRFTVYVTQDLSGRFDVTPQPTSLYFPLSSLFDLRRPDQSYTGEDAEVEFLRESMVMDRFSSTIRSRSSTYIRPAQDNDQLQLYVDLEPAQPLSLYLPFYLGRFRRERAKVLRDRISYRTVGAANTKAVEVQIEAELVPNLPPGESISMSQWELGPMDTTVAPTTQTTNHKISATFTYSPQLSQHNHTWDLLVSGSTSSATFVPPSLDLGKADFENEVPKRSTFVRRRRYAIEPSHIELSLPQDRPVRTSVSLNNAFKLEPPRCQNPTVEAALRLLPSVTLGAGSFKWQVTRPWRVSDLTVAAGPTAATIPSPTHELAPGDEITASAYKLKASPSRPYTLRVEWQGGRFYSDERLLIKAVGETDIGEALSATIELGSRCPVGQTRADEFFEDMIKGLIAIERFGDRLGSGPLPRSPTLLLAHLRLAPEYLAREIGPRFRTEIEAFSRYLEGEPLQGSDRGALDRLAKLGSAFSWDSRQNARDLALLKRGLTSSLALRGHPSSPPVAIPAPQNLSRPSGPPAKRRIP